MRKLPFCQQCVFYGGPGVCNEGGKPLTATHIQEGFWCIKGIMKDCGSCKHCGIIHIYIVGYCSYGLSEAHLVTFGICIEVKRF